MQLGMARHRPRIALRQGDLDGLCGVYAIINAIRVLDPSLDHHRCRALFKCLLGRLPKCVAPRQGLAAVHVGLTSSELKRLFENAQKHVATRLGLRIRIIVLTRASGKSHQARWSLAQLWKELAKHLDRGSSAILGLGGKYRHWTVAVRCTPRQIFLCDSGGLHILRRSQCTVGRARSRVMILPRHVLIVSKVGGGTDRDQS